MKVMNFMKKKSILLIGIMLVASMVLAACGDETSTLDQIQERGELTFAMTGQYPPFNYVADNGEIIGFDVDIANEIASRLGVEAKPITTDWDGILTGLMGGNFDVIIGSMAVTEERAQQVNFTRPYYFDGAQLFVDEASDVNGIEDFETADIGVVVGTTFESMLLEMDNINVRSYQSDVDNIRDLEMGRLDGLVTARFVGLYTSAQEDLAIRPAGEPLYVEEIAIPVRKSDKDLLEAINNALEGMIEDGTYGEISNRWFDYDMTEEIR